MENNNFLFPGCENVERKEDKKIWYWAECIEEAKNSGAKWFSSEFWLVYKYRVYETHGKYGFCVAGYEKLAEELGISPEQVKTAHQNACMKGRLFHIWCDKKVYRNKTKIYVTKEWLKERGLSAEQIKVLAKGTNNTHKLTGKVDVEGKIIEAEITKNEPETTSRDVETTSRNVETTSRNVESPLMNKCKNVSKGMCVNESFVTNVTKTESQNSRNPIKEEKHLETTKSQNNGLVPLMGKNDNANTYSQRDYRESALLENETPPVPPTPPVKADPKNRKVNRDGKVVGGNILVERAYELWEEIMGQPCKRDKWNSQAGWNMMRAKAKGEEWLRTMLIIARECKKDPKADFRASHVSNLADLQKNQDAVIGWARNVKLRKDTEADKSLDFLRQNS